MNSPKLHLSFNEKGVNTYLSLNVTIDSRQYFLGYAELIDFGDSFCELEAVVARKGHGEVLFNLIGMFCDTRGKMFAAARSGLTNEHARAHFDRLLHSTSDKVSKARIPDIYNELHCLDEDEEPFECELYAFSIKPSAKFNSIISTEHHDSGSLNEQNEEFFDRAYNYGGSAEIELLQPMPNIDLSLEAFKL